MMYEHCAVCHQSSPPGGSGKAKWKVGYVLSIVESPMNHVRRFEPVSLTTSSIWSPDGPEEGR